MDKVQKKEIVTVSYPEVIRCSTSALLSVDHRHWLV